MLNRLSEARIASLRTLKSALLASLTLGRSKRMERHRDRATKNARVECLEIRSLLSASSAGGLGDHNDEAVLIHSHPVFAPGTSADYVALFNDNVGAAGGTGVGGFDSTRWSTTATNGSGLSQGDLTTLTWSIVPDGTSIPALSGIATESFGASNLVSYLGGIYGVTTNDVNFTDEPWFAHYQSVFSRWGELTGINYVYSAADDGAAFSNTLANPGVLGVRGDVRIGGHHIDGNSNVLAYNFFPDHGDMVIDTGDNFFATTTGNSIRLRNTLAHEVGHGIGLSHVESNNAAFLMEPFIDTSFDGPQLDDILAAQRLYGDGYEANDSSVTATTLGTVPVGQSLTIGLNGNSTVVGASQVQFVSLDGTSDTDYFSFAVAAAGTVNVTMTPQGTTYNQGPQGGIQTSLNTSTLSDLNVQLVGTNGTTVLANGAANPAGPFKSLSFVVPSAGTYYAKVTGTANTVQTYQLSVGLANLVPAGVTIVQSSGTTEVTEGGAADSYTVVLTAQPAANVTVNIGGNGQVTTSTSSLTFTPVNWNVAQTVTVTAVNDLLSEATQLVTLTHTSSSTDALFNGLTIASVRVNVLDNDPAALSVLISPTSIFENGGTAFGRVTRNTTDNSQALTVTLSVSDNNELNVPSTVVIPAGASFANFFVSGVDDALLDGTQSVTVTASTFSGPAGLDPTFGAGGFAALGTGYAQSADPSFPEIIEQPDGKIIVAGFHPTDPNKWNVFRLNSNGTLDTTFGNSGVVTSTFTSEVFGVAPQGIALYPDGQIIVMGRGVGSLAHVVARYTSSGVENLRINSTATIWGNDIVVDNNGNGGFIIGGAVAEDFAALRYNANGTVDTTYGTAGIARLVNGPSTETGWKMVQQPDGKVVLAGTALNTRDFGVVRFTTNGTPDTSFSLDGFEAIDFGSLEFPHGLALQSDGKIVVVGSTASRTNWAIGRLLSNGTLDTSFSGDGKDVIDFFKLPEEARTVVVQNDGKIVVGGGAFVSGEGTNLALVRYNSNGSLDTTFDGDGRLVFGPRPGVFEETRALALQANGNIIALGGYNNQYSVFRINVGGGAAYQSGSATVQVNDYETVSLSISPATISENGGTATGTVTRSNTDIGSPITVSLFNGDPSEVSIPATVIIPAGQSSATFTITGVDDTLLDGSQILSISTGSPGYFGTAANITVTDDEVARLTVVINAASISEVAGVGATTATITRNTATTLPLTVTLTSSDLSELSVPLAVIIPAGQTSVTIPIDAVDDFIVDGTVTAAITASASGHSSGAGSVNVTDNDVAGIKATPVSGLVTTEGGDFGTFTVVLTSQPIANVSFSLTSSEVSEGTVIVSTLTFAAANWNVPQTVTVTGVDDLIVDGDIGFSVITGITTSSDPIYNGIDPTDVSVTNTDNDVAQLSLTLFTGTVSEGAGVAAISATVTRNTETSQPLTVTLFSNDIGEANVPVTVIIPAGASSVTFAIDAIDDLIVDGTQVVTISASAANHAGATGPLNVTDNDVAGFSIPDGGVLSVDESGTTQSFGIVLNAAPLTDVVFTISSGNPGEAVASLSTLTFTPSNWNVPQSVIVTGVDDFVDDDNKFSTITVSINASASDDAFDAVASQTVTALTFDDDTAGITFTPNTGLFVVEGSVSDSVAITLKTQPTADVTFALNNATPDQVTFSSSTVTFTSLNWNVPQVIVITGINNNIAEGGFGVGITPAPAVSLDRKYSGLQGSGANGSIIDDDFRRVLVEQVHEHVGENGTSTTFSIVLNSEPTGNVAIPISSGDLTEGAVSVSVLNFTPANWNVPQIVTVTGVDDAIVDGNIQFDVITGLIAGTSDYAGIDPEDVLVQNLDNDVLTLTMTVSASSISENGGTATGTVVRNDADLSQPLTVILSSSDTTEASVLETVTIPAGQTSVTFTISGVDDTLNDGVESVSISASASGYPGASRALTITDDDGPTISTNVLTIAEGATVVLSSANINVTDPEFTAAQLTYSMSGITNGRFELASAPGVGIVSFTQAQINAGAVRFVHNGGEIAPGYSLAVSDGTRTSPPLAATITFTNVNDAPVVWGGLGNVTVNQGVANQTISLLAAFSDVDNPTLSYSAVSSNGTLVGTTVSGSNLVLNFSATLSGSSTVTVTATDAGGLTVSTTFTVVVNSVATGSGVTLVNGVLTITGTSRNDWVQVDRIGNQYRVRANFTTASGIYFNFSAVQSIVVNVLDGNDSVEIGSSVLVPVTLNGGKGNDLLIGGNGANTINGVAGNDEIIGGSSNDVIDAGTGNDYVDGDGGNDLIYGGDGNDEIEAGSGNDTIYAGAGDDEIEGDAGNDLLFGEAGNDGLEGNDGNDILSGGSGNDDLNGGNGRDLLIGGLGADTLKAAGDDDILVGNRVTIEDNAAALQLVLAEWTSSRSYSSRVANLRGTGFGPRLNGTTFLSSSTVLNDNAIDTLMGSSGQDWFLGTIGQDLFTDRSSNEQRN